MAQIITPVLVFVLTLAALSKASAQANSSQIPATSIKPLCFTENNGQVADSRGTARPEILFTASSGGATVFLTANAIHYQFTKAPAAQEGIPGETCQKTRFSSREVLPTQSHRFSISLAGANATPQVVCEQRMPQLTKFYQAHCPQGITSVKSWERVIIKGVYPGIDWVLYSYENRLKYDFIVHPGAHASAIRMKIEGADTAGITDAGELLVKTTLGEVREHAPVSFIAGHQIASQFTRHEDGTFGFNIQHPVAANQTLIIDPTVSWATYYGGLGSDYGNGTCTDAAGHAYLTGYCDMVPAISAGIGHQNTFGGAGADAFLTKFDSAGNQIWTTYYGGDNNDIGEGCKTDNLGNVYLAGWTGSATAIASGGYQSNYVSAGDAMLIKFDSNGVRLWGTYYGAAGIEYGAGCAVSDSGYVYLCGSSESSYGIASAGHQTLHGGNFDAFLVKFSATGTRIWATYYGGSSIDYGYSCAVDPSGFVYLAGGTFSDNGIGYNGFQNAPGGNRDAFLVKFSAGGTRQWGTYYGGAGVSDAFAVQARSTRNVYIAGSTTATSGISYNGFQNTSGGGYDAMLVKFDSAGQREWGTYLGGSSYDGFSGCDVDAQGRVYACGHTYSANGIAMNGYQDTLRGYYDAVIARFTGAGALQWSTYYGGFGAQADYGTDCAADAYGNVYVAGTTTGSDGFAINAFQDTTGGYADAFLMKLGEIGQAPPGAVPTLGLADESVRIAPVPAFDLVTITTISTAMIGTTAVIIDPCGQQMASFVLRNSMDVRISGWAPGHYFLRLANGHALRFVKE